MLSNSRFPLFRLILSVFLIELSRCISKTTSTIVEEKPLDIIALSNFKVNSS